jgi:hypothetical protein
VCYQSSIFVEYARQENFCGPPFALILVEIFTIVAVAAVVLMHALSSTVTLSTLPPLSCLLIDVVSVHNTCPVVLCS